MKASVARVCLKRGLGTRRELRRKLGLVGSRLSGSRALSVSKKQEKVVLGIETSCDDTGIGIVTTEGEVLANCVASQFDMVREYGGVQPIIAARAHATNLPVVIEEAMNQATRTGKIKGWNDVDAIAVTSGPGLKPCLFKGVNMANELSEKYDIPLIPIHHLEGHALIHRLYEDSFCDFPFLALIASGGHTCIVKVNGVRDYETLGTTLDDAMGEAFDKVARMLELDDGSNQHPGRQLELLARQGNNQNSPFPIPLQRSSDLTPNFSFSGLKSAVNRSCSKNIGLADGIAKQDIAAGFQFSATRHVCISLQKAFALCGFADQPSQKQTKQTSNRMLRYKVEIEEKTGHYFEKPSVTGLVVSGGVASNQFLRNSVLKLSSEFQDLNVRFPPAKICTDNGLMIAWAAVELINAFGIKQGARAISDLDVDPRWKLDDL